MIELSTEVNHSNLNHVKDTSIQAFQFLRQSGAVIANYSDNRFDIKTSKVGAVRIFISPSMVNIKKPVIVNVNGKVLFNKKVSMDKNFILEQFQRNYDRLSLWSTSINLEIN